MVFRISPGGSDSLQRDSILIAHQNHLGLLKYTVSWTTPSDLTVDRVVTTKPRKFESSPGDTNVQPRAENCSSEE